MYKRIRTLIVFVVCNILLTVNVMGQRVSFGLYTSENLTIAPLGLGELNFNTKQPLILAGQSVLISLVDDETAVLSITGRQDQEITVTIDAPPTLDLDVSNKIPLAVRFAYSNVGAINDVVAKTSAIEVPAGFNYATFPMLRRASGLPTPPPTPQHSGYTAPTGTVYLFIYGSLGSVPVNAAAGHYTGDINIHVSYAQ